MKKLIEILCVCLLLTGCGTRYKDASDKKEDCCGGYFVKIKSWDSDEGCFDIVYADDTKVKYLIWRASYKGGITPLYNADGSLQIYEEE